MLLHIEDEYESMLAMNALDMPAVLVPMSRAFIHEDLAYIYTNLGENVLAKKFAKKALAVLSQDPWMQKLYPKRIERLTRMSRVSR